MPKLLFLLSNPDDNVKLRMDREVKEINRVISPVVLHDFDCIQIHAISIEELPGIIIKEKPNILHFSGHGKQNALCFEDRNGKTKIIDESAIENIFKEVGKFVNCLVINACNSSTIARKLTNYVPYIISFPDKIEDELVEPFSKTFYEVLSHGQSIESSFNLAKAVIESYIEDKTRLPEMFINQQLNHSKSTLFHLPYITANFNLSKNKPIIKLEMYSLKFVVKNMPNNASYILYELIDSSIPEKYRFHLVTDLSAGNSFDFRLFGNVIIKAWIWFGDKKYGIGIESTVNESLDNFYGDNIPKNCLKAYDDVTSK